MPPSSMPLPCPAASRQHFTAHRRACLVALAAGCLVPAAYAQPAPAGGPGRLVVEGQAFDLQARVGDANLVLNGAGLRAVAWLKGYAAGLYLRAKAGSTAEVLNTPGPKRLQLRMMQNVGTIEFIKAVDKGVPRNAPEAERPRLVERTQAFNTILREMAQVKKGDVVNIDFLPGQGLVLSWNGKVRGQPIAGEDFYAAVLRIFLGPKPTDDKLKAALLGAPWVP